MVEKKNILTDLKKFNKELEKHLPALDSDFLNKDFLNKESAIDDDYYALLASNLVDIRTELSILRKNMANDIEGMVLKMISNQETQFLNQINKFYGQIIGDLKQSFATYITEMNGEVSSLKKKITEISTKNEEFENKLSTLNENILEFKTLVNKFDNHSTQISFSIENKFEKFLEEIKDKSGNINELSSKLNNIENNIITLNKKFINLEHTSKKLIKQPKNEKLTQIENKLDKFNEEIKNLEKKKITEKIVVVDKQENIKNHIHKFSNSKIDKLLEIDNKLNKLNSLR